jgi:hypothetical protein
MYLFLGQNLSFAYANIHNVTLTGLPKKKGSAFDL